MTTNESKRLAHVADGPGEDHQEPYLTLDMIRCQVTPITGQCFAPAQQRRDESQNKASKSGKPSDLELVISQSTWWRLNHAWKRQHAR
jgi:hypothetical protein